jgi:hypothetical protein
MKRKPQNQPSDPPTADEITTPRPDPRLNRLERRLLEAFNELWDDFVDPADALYDVDGCRWARVGEGGLPGAALGVPFAGEQQLAEIRAHCRWLAVTNEFAINGHDSPLS